MAEKMLVEERMTRHLETIDPEDYLAAAQAKMRQGNFQRLPVVQDGRVVGIITDRDLREHRGILERTKVGAVMTQNVITVRPEVTLEKAARLLLTHKVGGLPVMDGDHLAGMITRSDILQAFLDLVGASEEDSFRIDFVMGEGHDLSLASRTIADAGGEVLGGLGTFREGWNEDRVSYLHVRGRDPNRLADALAKKGYKVLGVHV